MTTNFLRYIAPVLLTCLVLDGCNGERQAGDRVESSGKEATGLEAVPAEVLQAALNARPELEIEAAEHEVRDGRDYYDLAGKTADGAEVELDLTTVDGAWTVVEIQRDILMDQVPQPVRQALAEAASDWAPDRIIESDQGDGVVIYEFFGPGPGSDELKREVKWQENRAALLQDEWKH
jgi:predicted small secreted protein